MKIKVAVNGYGVIGKRVADAVSMQDDMELAGVCDVVTDWRIKMAGLKNYPVFASDDAFKSIMNEAGIKTSGTLDDLLASSDIIVDCTPKKIAAQNIDHYKKLGKKFILQGGEKHETTGHSFSAENNYATALNRDSTRVVSCNTTSIVITSAVIVPETLSHLHYWNVQLTRKASKEEVLDAFKRSSRITMIEYSQGLSANNTVKELNQCSFNHVG